MVLLLTVTGFKEGTRYLVAVGCIRMLQNVIMAGISVEPPNSGIPLKQWSEKPSIVGYQTTAKAKEKLRERAWNESYLKEAEG